MNDILTIHGREFENVVRPIIEKKSLLYADKEKTLDFISSSAPIADATRNQEYDPAAKIVQNFQNSTIPEKNISDDTQFSIVNSGYARRENDAKRDDDFQTHRMPARKKTLPFAPRGYAPAKTFFHPSP